MCFARRLDKAWHNNMPTKFMHKENPMNWKPETGFFKNNYVNNLELSKETEASAQRRNL